MHVAEHAVPGTVERREITKLAPFLFGDLAGRPIETLGIDHEQLEGVVLGRDIGRDAPEGEVAQHDDPRSFGESPLAAEGLGHQLGIQDSRLEASRVVGDAVSRLETVAVRSSAFTHEGVVVVIEGGSGALMAGYRREKKQ